VAERIMRMRVEVARSSSILHRIVIYAAIIAVIPAYYILSDSWIWLYLSPANWEMFDGGKITLPVAVVGSIICVLLLSVMFKGSRRIWSTTAGIQIGYMIWLCIILAMMHIPYSSPLVRYVVPPIILYVILGHIVIILLSVVWLYKAPGIWPIVVIVLVHSLTFIDSSRQLWFGWLQWTTVYVVIAHELFRGAIIVTAVTAFLAYRKAGSQVRANEIVGVFD
jgi:hypothetical protein